METSKPQLLYSQILYHFKKRLIFSSPFEIPKEVLLFQFFFSNDKIKGCPIKFTSFTFLIVCKNEGEFCCQKEETPIHLKVKELH